MEIFLPAAYALIFCLVIWYVRFFHLPGLKTRVAVFLFLIKIVAGIILSIIYTRYYNPGYGDTINYYRDGVILFDLLRTDPAAFLQMMTGYYVPSPAIEAAINKMSLWSRSSNDLLPNDYRFMIRLNTLIVFFSFKNYYVHLIFMNFISFTGLVWIYRFFSSYYSSHPFLPAAAVFLLPSVVFWGSGILKESVLLFAMGLLLNGLFPVHRALNVSRCITLMAAIALLMFNKLVVSVIFLPFIIFLVWVDWTGYRSVFKKYVIFTGTLASVFFLYSWFAPIYHPAELISRKYNDMIALSIEQGAGSLISTEKLKPAMTDVVKKIPEALITTAFRPHLLDIKNILYLPSALENVLLWLLCLLPLFYFYKPDQPRLAIALAFLSFSLALFIVIGLTTPVLGAVVRYKMPALPFLACSLLLLTDTDKILKKLKPKSSGG